jgi:hypothetical protein
MAAFFENAKTIAFAKKAFARAGLDFDAIVAAGDDQALKKILAGGRKPGVGTSPDLTAAAAKKAWLLAETAKQEDEKVKLEARVASGEQLEAVLARYGINMADVLDPQGAISQEKFKAAWDRMIASKSRIALMRAGHLHVDEVLEDLADEQKRDPAATGSARVRGAIERDLAAIRRGEPKKTFGK